MRPTVHGFSGVRQSNARRVRNGRYSPTDGTLVRMTEETTETRKPGKREMSAREWLFWLAMGVVVAVVGPALVGPAAFGLGVLLVLVAAFGLGWRLLKDR